MTAQDGQQTPGPGVDLTTLPEEGWRLGRMNDLDRVDRSGTTESIAIELDGEARPVVIVDVRGAKTGEMHRIPLMRVEHDGRYALVGSKGGAAKSPTWCHNLRVNPDVVLQDEDRSGSYLARELAGEERAVWWERAVRDWGLFANYADAADRLIPVFLLEPVAS
jgi:F420H(2)-dependent quinone reductase